LVDDERIEVERDERRGGNAHRPLLTLSRDLSSARMPRSSQALWSAGSLTRRAVVRARAA
jgi:hypothetical protein